MGLGDPYPGFLATFIFNCWGTFHIGVRGAWTGAKIKCSFSPGPLLPICPVKRLRLSSIAFFSCQRASISYSLTYLIKNNILFFPQLAHLLYSPIYLQPMRNK